MCLICLRFSIFICLFKSWYDFRKEADIEFTTNTFLDPILQKNMGLYLESMRKKSKKWPRSKIFSKFWCSAKHIDKNRQISWFELTIFAEGRGQTNYSKCHEFPVCLEPLPYQSQSTKYFEKYRSNTSPFLWSSHDKWVSFKIVNLKLCAVQCALYYWQMTHRQSIIAFNMVKYRRTCMAQNQMKNDFCKSWGKD